MTQPDPADNVLKHLRSPIPAEQAEWEAALKDDRLGGGCDWLHWFSNSFGNLVGESVEAMAAELTRLQAENDGYATAFDDQVAEIGRLQAENARLREACRNALADVEGSAKSCRELAQSYLTHSGEVSGEYFRCTAKAVAYEHAAELARRHLAAAERAEKASDHAE